MPKDVVSIITEQGRLQAAKYCPSLSASDIGAGNVCQLGSSQSIPPSFVVWGDSHANALTPAFDALATKTNTHGWMVRMLGCPPLMGVWPTKPPKSNACSDFNDSVMTQIENHKPEFVVLVARWSAYSSGWPKGGLEENAPQPFLSDSQTSGDTMENSREVFERGLRLTFLRLQKIGTKVFVVEQVPEFKYPVPESLARLKMLAVPIETHEPTLDEYRRRQEFFSKQLDQFSLQYSFTRINLSEVLCMNGRCQLEHQDHPLYRDDNHLSNYGAFFVSPSLLPIFER